MYYLQNRWRLEGRELRYYGMRRPPYLFGNRVRLSGRKAALIASLPRDLGRREIRALGSLVGEQIVAEKDLRRSPKGFDDAAFCTECCANDYMIPGLEFDEYGRCPMCASADKTRDLVAVLPVVETVPRSEGSEYDIALFYTGGKDSTYLLYYLSKKLGLRVLALTWEIPFMSDSARASIEGAKIAFPDVRFVSRKLEDGEMRRVYGKLLSIAGNTCACPSLAYVLFYEYLVRLRVPYFASGNEPVQALGLYFNHFAPRIAFTFAENKPLNFLLNAGRVLTLKPPLKTGQRQTLMAMNQLAFGDSPIKRLAGYRDELVSNIVIAINEAESVMKPFRQAVKRSSRSGHIPAFVHFDLNAICGGTYDWEKVKKTLVEECGWVPPDDGGKALHTSCKIERCKDYTQFVRFRDYKSRMIPFSAIEISLASRNCGRTKDQMIYEMKEVLGFTEEPPCECALMEEYGT
ncbi:MAG: hypothetical protein IJM71_08520 [Clostridia bacterium]|nr:hypothetical protein [Clostridia bacterium]